MAINAVSGVNGFNVISPSKNITDNAATTKFSDFLSQQLDQVNQLQNQATQASEDIVSGKSDNIHEALIIGEKANTSLQFTMQVRNKVLDAYNEIMRMSI